MKNKLLLTAIIVLGSVLRLAYLDRFPNHLTPDEAALGYNAYSIIKTARDEHGEFLPIIFKSFGDYKPGLYVYAAIPFVMSLGLSELAVRLPSAIAGILLIWIAYKLFCEVINEKIGFWLALVCAINPWLIFFSRGAWEANLSLTIIIAGVFLLVKFFNSKQNKYLFGASFLMGLSLITYHGAKLSMPLALLAVVAVYWKDLIKTSRRALGLAAILGIIVGLPILLTLVTGQAGRLSVFSILSYRRESSYVQEYFVNLLPVKNELFINLWYGHWFTTLTGVLRRFGHYFDPRFLFTEGDWEHPALTTPYMGVLLLADLIPLLAGLYYLIKKPSKLSRLIWLLFILLPLPAALSRDEVNSVRALPLVLPYVMVIGFGWYKLDENLRARNWNWVLFGILGVTFINVVYAINLYMTVAPMKTSLARAYGHKQLVEQTRNEWGNGSKIVMSQSYAQPYIYFLFYNLVDPSEYQQNHTFVPSEYGDVGLVSSALGKLEFRSINWSVDQYIKGWIFIGDPVTTITPERSNETNRFEAITIKDPAGNAIYQVVKVL